MTTEVGALSLAGWVGSARGDKRYGGKWVWLAGRGRCTKFSIVITRQAAGSNGRCASTGGFLVSNYKINSDGQLSKARD